MASSVEDIHTAIVDLWKVNHATPTAIDLSGTDAVKRGSYALPWGSAPCVCVWLDSISTTRTSDAMGAVPLGRWSRTESWRAVGWMPLQSTQTADAQYRAVQGMRLADVLLRALEADRDLGSRVIDLEIQVEAIGGQGTAGADQYGVCSLIVTTIRRVTTGV